MLRALAIFVACVIVIAAIVWGVGVSSCEQQPKEHGESAETDKAKKEDCSSFYAAFKVGLYGSWRFVREYHDEVVALGTAFVAIFTIILGMFTVSLAGSTQELVREARQTGERQLRAYISITPKDTINWAVQSPTHKVGVHMHVKNHGKTPGFGILYNFSMAIQDEPVGSNFVTDCIYNQNNTIFPDEVLSVRLFLERDLTRTYLKIV